MDTLFVLMRNSSGLYGPGINEAMGIYDTREAALAAKGNVLNTGKTTTANMMDWTIIEVPYHKWIKI